MNIRKKLTAAMLACLIGAVGVSRQTAYADGGSAKTEENQEYVSEKPSYLKSVTYFGDEWPINYWGSEDRYMSSNFEKIKADGFNSIILVIPWREFQPNENGEEFNRTAFERLDKVMACAEEHGLWVVLRIGYTWDYYGKSELPARFYGAIRENGLDRQLWLRYCQEIYKTASKHSNFHSGFMTWEDFWDYVHNMGREISKPDRIDMARTSGYQEYLQEHYTLGEINAIYGENFENFNKVYIPYRTHPSAELFFDFYDQMLNGLLAHSQTVFPGLSMEVRADADKVYDSEGGYHYYSHKATYPCVGADYSAVMYSVSMGQRNESDKISAAAALAGTNRTMSSLYSLSGKPIYAEQLLYMDSTEEFSYNTQILEEETDDYVQALAPTLKNYTTGYGLWVYRNYVNNCVYNGQFGLGTEGWTLYSGCHLETVDGTPMAKLGGKRKLFQKLTGRLSYREEIHVEFYAKPVNGKTDVTVMIGNKAQVIRVTEAGTYTFTLPWQHTYDLTISSDKDVFIDDIKVYSYEQYGRIYDVEGNELNLADDFRILNAQLSE